MSSDLEEQEDELLALHSIFDSEEFIRNESNNAGELRVSAELPPHFSVSLTEGETVRQYEISFLPHLLLTFTFPADYPSSSPPSFTLTCSWLTPTQLSALGSHLTDLYQATRGAVVLFSWVQFLREDVLRFLDIHTTLELPSDDHSSQASQNTALSLTKNNPGASESGSTDEQSWNSTDVEVSASASSGKLDTQGAAASMPVQETLTAGLSLTPSQTLLSQILIHDAEQRQKAFAFTVFDCSVCCVGWLGSDCVHLSECGHILCKGCLAEFCRIRITEGNVRGVTCPQANCTASPTPAQVKDLVGDELFSRYDRLLLMSTLDRMSDVTYCPQRACGSPVILEKSSTAAMCSVCNFAFCVICKKTYHGTNNCAPKASVAKRRILTDEQQGVVDLPQSREGMKVLMDDYTGGSKERKRLLLNRYGRKAMQVILPEYLSEDWVVIHSKNCPHCFCKIQKDGGCNMMTCTRCRRRFCWRCLTRLPEFGAGGHFEDGTCSLHTGYN
ncbi:E3 ubiquitin-protein ligase RNF14-like [Solea senegalensis]|uniref:RBR-type E3 ubiquitin transferase n=1 Tax=Solea senegalensis TaxID=28829 RepID=A0AAV6SBY5_SOLSE|nr:E3 ubiquitin-protein ligase RNF14-like isoform X1 [Solea senegalensis]KAG7514122.1 E3 ubiquitin-protein ligase RNF14-like [Solea senegalensis]